MPRDFGAMQQHLATALAIYDFKNLCLNCMLMCAAAFYFLKRSQHHSPLKLRVGNPGFDQLHPSCTLRCVWAAVGGDGAVRAAVWRPHGSSCGGAMCGLYQGAGFDGSRALQATWPGDACQRAAGGF